MKYVAWSSLMIWVYVCSVFVCGVSLWAHCESIPKQDESRGSEGANDHLDSKDVNPSSNQIKQGVKSENDDQKNLKDSKEPTEEAKTGLSPLHLYQLLFREKRKSHREAVKAILKLKAYDKQYSMVKLIMEKMFSTTEEAKIFLMEAGFTPGDPFPTNEKMRDAMSMILENTVFFGDILLHLPDITHDLLRRHKQWDLMARWGISFCNNTQIYEASEQKLLNLMAQELGIIEKDPNYVNPYKINQKELQKEIEKLLKEPTDEPVKKDKKKKRKEKKRGPRLSSIPHSEL